jgi:hypothetical protein
MRDEVENLKILHSHMVAIREEINLAERDLMSDLPTSTSALAFDAEDTALGVYQERIRELEGLLKSVEAEINKVRNRIKELAESST